MGQLSKYFDAVTASKTCRDMLHPGHDCVTAWKIFLYQGIIGGMRHYLPGVITPVFFRFHQLNDPTTWITILKEYLRCILAGLPMTAGSFHAFCLFFKLMGRFPAPWFVFVPSLTGGLLVKYLPKHVVRTQGIGLFNMYVEFLIRRIRNKYVQSLRSSKFAATTIFMTLSGAMMAALQYLDINRFWFATNYSPSIQHHSGVSCFRHILGETKKSFLFGLAISMIKTLLPHIGMIVRNPLKLLHTLVTQFDYGLIAFITSYKMLHEVSHCWLTKDIDHSSIKHSAIAGVIAGLAYLFYPNYILFTYPISELIELCWLCYMKNPMLPKPFIVQYIDRLPTSMLIYTISLGMLCHLRVVYPYHVNRYWYKAMSNGTAGRSETLARCYADIMFGYK